MKEYIHYKTRITPIIKSHIKHMFKCYHELKKLTRTQRGEYAEDTDRYNRSIKWYEIISETLEEWRTTTPYNAEVISHLFGIGDRSRAMTPVEVSLKLHISKSSVYTLKDQFIYEIAFKAIKEKLITF